MKPLTTAPNLADRVRDAIVEEITAGRLAAGERLIQEQVAQALGVSRQPVQQALLRLRDQGVLREAPGRGLVVAPLDPDEVQHMYDLRGAIEALAARLAARHSADRAAKLGPALIDAGRKTAAGASVPRMVAADRRFHEFVYELSANPLVAPTMGPHWTYTERVMAEVLLRDETPRDVWDQHAAILDAIAAGDADRAEVLARAHNTQAAAYMTARLRSIGEPASAA